MKQFFQVKLLIVCGAVSILLLIIYGLPYLTEKNSPSTNLVAIKPSPTFISESCWAQLLEYLSQKLSEDGLQTDSKIQSEIQNTISRINYPNGYDVNLSAIARTRLGYATTPEFQIIPKPWSNILNERRSKVLESHSKIKVIDNYNQSQRDKTEDGLVTTRKKRILIYHNDWGLSCPNDKNPEFKCDYVFWSKLNVSTSTSFAETAKKFDAVVVYRDMRHQQKIILDNSNAKLNPKVIYWTFEPASIPIWKSWDMQIKPRGEGGSRDLLASYWRGSDIYTPYFKWKYYDKNVISKKPKKNYAKGRTKMAAIVVSNCEPRNNRMGLVEELAEYINVDTFGKCGKTECRKKDCWNNIQKNYKFYLSFENSNCRDYITEKLFKNAWGHNLVPIVFGAHPMDYKTICPANSYIHVEDFESIEKLAEYLQVLDKNDTLYNSYFAWKGTGELKAWSFQCEFCYYLHTQDLNQYPKFHADFGKLDAQNVKEYGLPYFNDKDSYNFDVFNWSKNNTEMCLQNNQRYWNRGYK